MRPTYLLVLNNVERKKYKEDNTFKIIINKMTLALDKMCMIMVICIRVIA